MWTLWPLSRRIRAKSATSSDDEILPCGKCQLCVVACPTGALEYRDRVWRVSLDHCIFCRSCAEVCPNHLISPQEA